MATEYLDLYDLTVEKIDPEIGDYSFTITGDGGVGKSTFANALFNKIGTSVTFGCEDRFKGLPNLKLVPIWKDGWEAFVGYKTRLKKGLKQAGKLPFTHIVIDPVGQLGDMCEEYICQENGWENISSAPYGAGYNAFEKEFVDAIKELRATGVKVNFISHGKSETITPPRQEGYQVQMPDIQKKLKYIVKDEVDFLLYLSKVRKVDKDGNSVAVRRLYLQNYPEYSLKVPLNGFPDYIEWDGPVEEGVDKFIEAFNHAVEVTKAQNKTGSISVDNPKNEVSGETVVGEEKNENKAENEADEDREKAQQPKVRVYSDDEIAAMKAKAESVRDKMIESGMSKVNVAKTMREIMSTAKIKEVDDPNLLMDFIEQCS